jgi:hypothetical protein
MGGLIVRIMMVGEPNLLSILTRPITVSIALGPILTFMGFVVASIGFITAFYYDRKRAWYVGELKKSSTYKRKKAGQKTADEVPEEYARERGG